MGAQDVSLLASGRFLHRHPLPPRVVLRTGEEVPLVGGLDFDLEPPGQPEGVGPDFVRWGDVHCQEVGNSVAAVGDGAALTRAPASGGSPALPR